MNVTLTTAQLLLVAAATAIAPAALAAPLVVDDFESYTAGDLDVVATPAWTAEYAGLSQIASAAGNQYIVNAGDSDWSHSYRSLGASVTQQAVLSFDIYVEDDVEIDHAFGLTDSSEAVDWYGDYGPYVRVTPDGPGAAGIAGLDVRDGGGFVDDIAQITTGVWHNVKLAVDTAGGGSFDVYLNDAPVYSGAGFRRGYGAPLENFLLMAGQNTSPLVRVDNVTIDVIPEPASLMIGFVGLAAIAAGRRRD
ncbi:hypothetical protein Mal64_08870 [Pseudobythopirellula maris]|uniref:PEP-CTERM protein-sorting domain-containing protein n=1 Tax=Pseudobythopirellula maris TaxID=2527991 RepID=A0A5C5ZTE9_9BACT|nr:PEP-CTERM sorting domain-containing protein [Pseudobythopirellula maris]TWT90496.1 hypothetical protein Mal64_08870 [Pseudobythopirellula maris]